MKILITGATGFVGWNFLKRLRESQIKTVCLVRKESKNLGKLEQFDTELRFCDLEKSGTLDGNLFKDIDFVYHFAGSVFGKTRKELYRTNVDGTENLFHAIRHTPVRRFVFLSSLAAVGPVGLDDIITEETIPHPISWYGRSKLEAERRLRNLVHDVGKEICIVRTPLIYGEGLSNQSRLALFIDKIRDGSFKFIGGGKNKVCLCQLDNLIDFLLKVLELDGVSFKVFHIADSAVITMKELANLISEHIGVKLPSGSIPISVAQAIGFLLDLIGKAVPIKYDMTLERVREFAGNWRIDLTKAKKWGYEPKEDWKEQLLATVSWHLQRRGND